MTHRIKEKRGARSEVFYVCVFYRYLVECPGYSPCYILRNSLFSRFFFFAPQEMAAKKAALLEGKARREERNKAVAKRSASVVRLMELESDGIRLEKEAVVSLFNLCWRLDVSCSDWLAGWLAGCCSFVCRPRLLRLYLSVRCGFFVTGHATAVAVAQDRFRFRGVFERKCCRWLPFLFKRRTC